MKKTTNIIIISTIPIILVTILICYSILVSNQLKECNNKKATNVNLCNINDTNYQEETSTNIKEKEYNCSFTVTYRIVNLLDNYIAEVPEYSYIVVDKFQDHKPISHYIPTNLKTNLELNKYYEFTYHIKGKGNINNIYDVINNINTKHLTNNNLSVTLTIKETSKIGLEQIQENICS